MDPRASRSASWVFNSACSAKYILYAGRAAGLLPGTRSIVCSIARRGGRPLGKLSLNTSAKSPLMAAIIDPAFSTAVADSSRGESCFGVSSPPTNGLTTHAMTPLPRRKEIKERLLPVSNMAFVATRMEGFTAYQKTSTSKNMGGMGCKSMLWASTKIQYYTQYLYRPTQLQDCLGERDSLLPACAQALQVEECFPYPTVKWWLPVAEQQRTA